MGVGTGLAPLWRFHTYDCMLSIFLLLLYWETLFIAALCVIVVIVHWFLGLVVVVYYLHDFLLCYFLMRSAWLLLCPIGSPWLLSPPNALRMVAVIF